MSLSPHFEPYTNGGPPRGHFVPTRFEQALISIGLTPAGYWSKSAVLQAGIFIGSVGLSTLANVGGATGVGGLVPAAMGLDLVMLTAAFKANNAFVRRDGYLYRVSRGLSLFSISPPERRRSAIRKSLGVAMALGVTFVSWQAGPKMADHLLSWMGKNPVATISSPPANASPGNSTEGLLP